MDAEMTDNSFRDRLEALNRAPLPDSPTLARRIQDAIKSAATAARPAISNTLLEPPVRTDVEAKAVPGQAVAAPFAAVVCCATAKWGKRRSGLTC